MQISKKKRQELYECIHKNITDLRVEIALSKSYRNTEAGASLDVKLAQLERPIWQGIKEVLGID